MKLSSKERWFVFFAMLSAMTICGEYAMTRPTSNALFLTQFSSKGYPWVWLATVPLNLAVIYLYNRFLPKFGPLKILWTFAIATAGINALAGVLYFKAPLFIFFQYAWKDIYVLLMLKQLWSMIHSTLPASRAKYLYGCIYGVGTIGAISGSLIPGFLATYLGSEKILYLTIPVYLLLLFAYTMAFNRSGVNESTFTKDLTPDPRPREAFSLIRRSPVLIAVLLLVVFMQVSVGLMEYQFNAHLELNILEKDLRTAYCGKLGGLVNLLSLAFQFIGGFLMIRTLGLRGSHFLIPILLCTSALSAIALPTFAILSASYVFLKAVDFSLFGVIREMLYVPLQLDAKFRAKAIIDVFAYRTSKALVSLGLLLLQIVAGSYLLQLTSYISIAVFIGWLATVAILFRKRENVSLTI
jgi:AAA family ATP:ADP antiporter